MDIRKRFSLEMNTLFDDVIRLGNLVKESVQKSVDSLLHDDSSLARTIIKDDDVLNQLEISLHDQAIKINSLYEDAWFNKGAVMNILGEKEKAKECISEVLKINPYNESAHEALKITERK